MDNRERILQCALELFYAKGYDAVGVQEIAQKAGITKQILDTRYEEEYEKYIQSNKELKGNEDLLQSAQNNAKESLLRIRMIKDIMETGDLGSLNTLIPMDKVCVNETIRGTLENLKKSGVIADYSVLKMREEEKWGFLHIKHLWMRFTFIVEINGVYFRMMKLLDLKFKQSRKIFRGPTFILSLLRGAMILKNYMIPFLRNWQLTWARV